MSRKTANITKRQIGRCVYRRKASRFWTVGAPLTSGHHYLDREQPMLVGYTTVIAGAPGTGKSTLAYGLAKSICLNNKPPAAKNQSRKQQPAVLFITSEFSSQKYAQYLSEMERANMPGEVRNARKAPNFGGWKIIVVAMSYNDAGDVNEQIFSAIRNVPGDVKLLVIDTLDLLYLGDKYAFIDLRKKLLDRGITTIVSTQFPIRHIGQPDPHDATRTVYGSMADQVLVTNRVAGLIRHRKHTTQSEIQYTIVKKRGASTNRPVTASRIFEFLRRP